MSIKIGKAITHQRKKKLMVLDDTIADMEAIKSWVLLLPNCSYEDENSTFHMFLYNNLISKKTKTVRLNMTHFIMKIPNKKKLQQIASHQSSDIEF